MKTEWRISPTLSSGRPSWVLESKAADHNLWTPQAYCKTIKQCRDIKKHLTREPISL
jgi:hypothetical protein